MRVNPPAVAPHRLLRRIFAAIGVLIMVLSTVGSLVILFLSAPSGTSTLLPIILLVGGIPFVIGWFTFILSTRPRDDEPGG